MILTVYNRRLAITKLTLSSCLAIYRQAWMLRLKIRRVIGAERTNVQLMRLHTQRSMTQLSQPQHDLASSTQADQPGCLQAQPALAVLCKTAIDCAPD